MKEIIMAEGTQGVGSEGTQRSQTSAEILSSLSGKTPELAKAIKEVKNQLGEVDNAALLAALAKLLEPAILQQLTKQAEPVGQPYRSETQKRLASQKGFFSYFEKAAAWLEGLKTKPQPLTPQENQWKDNWVENNKRILGEASFEEINFTIESFQEKETSGNLSSEEQTFLKEALDQRDQLLKEANEVHKLFTASQDSLVGIYYGSRVKVSRVEKEGQGEYEGRGTLQKLATLQEIIRDPSLIEKDRTGRVQQIVRESRLFLGEEQTGFWKGKDLKLVEKFRGIVDYFNRKGIDLVADVVKNRKIYTQQDPKNPKYLDEKFCDLWKGVAVRDALGHVLVDEDGREITAENFDDIRDAIEEARRREPWVPNRLDWEAYTRFVADDPAELEEMMPYIVARVIRKLGTGQPDKLSTKGEQEKERLDAAMANFQVESEDVFRRLKSELNANLNATLTYFFSDHVRTDWGPYLSYLNLLAEGAQNTEQQDHLVDAFILDRDGLTMLAAQQFLVEDGIYWRYGQNSKNLDPESHEKPRDMSKLSRWQVKRKREISHFLMNHKLRKMGDLLNLTLDQQGNITGYGVPRHPAFQRLKKIYDEQDTGDKKITGTGQVLDADGNPTSETRWQEYCRKALDWERTGRFGNPGEAPRVIFQHPLARSFKRPTKTATGQVYYEFLDMFEVDKDVSEAFLDSIKKGVKPTNATSYERTTSRKVKSNMQKAEHLCRNLMLDSAAVLAWHYCKTQDEVNEINSYLVPAGIDRITINEAIPQKTLYRALMQALIREDKTKLPKDRTFKIYDVLTELLDIDIDLPTFGAWYIGAHDTTRSTLLLAAIDKDTRPGGLKEAMPAPEMDEKNTGTMWGEKERRMGLLVQMVMFAKFGRVLKTDGKKESRYFNFPGHDTKGEGRKGAGVKDIRNYLNLLYGTSRGTVWLDDLLDVALPLEPELPKNYGATEDVITELVGLAKGGNEAIFAQTGYEGILENPRDWTSAVKRTATNEQYSRTLITGNKDKEGYAMLKDGPFRRMYRWRDYSISNLEHGFRAPQFSYETILNNPAAAISEMNEATYKAGLDLAAEIIEPAVIAMKDVVESTFGPNPGTAKFARSLLKYGIFKWMDTSWEYRGKPGYAVDGNLHIARYMMNQYLLEYGDKGLIYYDNEWDEIMLGYITQADDTRVIRYEVEAGHPGQTKKFEIDKSGNRTGEYEWVTGVVQEGLIDAFPKKLRDEIINGKDVAIIDGDGKVVSDQKGNIITYKDYILPFGMDSTYPETFANYFRDTKAVREDYKNALGQIKPRKKVTRP